MTEQSLQPDIDALVEARDFAGLKAVLRDMDPVDAAELIGELSGDALTMTFRLLPHEMATDVFWRLEIDRQEALITELSSDRAAALVRDMAPDDRTELLEELPGEVAQRLLSHLRGEDLRTAQSLLAYPPESIGRLMTPEYAAVRPDWTVEQVLAHIRQVAPSKETLNVTYVIDDHGVLLDELPLEQIVLASPDRRVEQLMDRTFAALSATDDQEAAIELFKKYDAVALPVVDRKGVLVGIVTFDDALDVAEEESTEDFQKMTAMEPLDGGYFATGFGRILLKRAPWLGLLLMAQILTTVALTSFHGLELFAVLVVFVPLVNSPAGNAGAQMAGLMIRGLALEEIDVRDWGRVVSRELLRGLTLGVVLGAIGYVAAYAFAPWAGAQGGMLPRIAVSVALAIAVAVTLANIVGAMLPFAFNKLGLDPAVTSGPFLASVMDVSGICIYFAIATALLAASLG
ncbi:MAG: magnesium transporter [Phycisphaerae bacterium]|nr:magnesium transporter [Phycisphaerae bacterium]